MLYLASPIAHLDPEVVEARIEAAARAAADLMSKGYVVFCPAAHSYLLKAQFSVQPSHADWMRQDLAVLRRAERMVVLRLDGWKESRGVKIELAVAEAAQIPVDYADPVGPRVQIAMPTPRRGVLRAGAMPEESAA
jgi:uncharacterized protein DUF1937